MSEVLASSTIFSLNADLPTALPAPAEGYESALDSAILVGEERRILCRISRFTAAGATLRLTVDALAEGEAHILELRNGQAIPGTIAWLGEGEAGFLFDAAMDVVGTLARNLAILPAERRRVPRVEVRQTVCLHRGNNVEFTRTRDISQAGVGIETGLALQEGDEVQLAFDGLRPIAGKVRWERDGLAGIAFNEELGWQMLMPWLREVQSRPVRPAPRLHDIHEERGFGLTSDKNAIRINAPGRVREGTIWWNVEVRNLTPTLVEFEAAADFSKGTQLWFSLPGTAGWPISVIEAENLRYLAEFRLPLRQHELAMIAPGRLAAG
ncbi:PilZ domain-containing protein [Sphingomonas sp. LB-2]|uniref:PilZ domain-containing protein n=1 Tax=Sphingomonas caeni TaxID=2984949 RepID=UPI00222E9D3E|nr:PilZ domain-containing protein [Sphingomonas caeni]MCW3847646.1 PilZ domain-containing protein [Sphingomonas caeni]